MAMTVGQADDDDLNSQINTTPLVDVMLVLLIIFLITIPVVIHNIPVELPKERNVPTQTKPENVMIAIDRDGNVFWNNQFIEDAQPDVVSAWNMGAMSLGLLTALVERDVPIVYNVYDDWLVYGPKLDAWTRLFRRRPRLGRMVRARTGVPGNGWS